MKHRHKVWWRYIVNVENKNVHISSISIQTDVGYDLVGAEEMNKSPFAVEEKYFDGFEEAVDFRNELLRRFNV